MVPKLPFAILAIRLIHRAFAIRMLLAVVALFGGVFLGPGSGPAVRGGAALDGIEVLALYAGRGPAFTTGEIILGIS